MEYLNDLEIPISNDIENWPISIKLMSGIEVWRVIYETMKNDSKNLLEEK